MTVLLTWLCCSHDCVVHMAVMLQVRREVAAQLNKFAELVGAAPVHTDGHQHAHVVPGVLEAIVTVRPHLPRQACTQN